MAWQPGTKLHNGRYTIQREIGQGRFGITYLVRDKKDKPFVIKTLNDQALQGNEFERLQQVFIQEAFKLAKCQHPHIVEARELFKDQGLWCMVTEYIEGEDLAKRSPQILPEAEALQYIQQIGSALIEVHDNGLLHRDVRPGNILIRRNTEEAVLIDFGLALDFDRELTKKRTEEIVSGFAAPELYSETAQRGPYTDIYALGATLYVLLTKETPADAFKRACALDKLVAPKEINSQISDRLNKAILKALKVDSSDRPQSVAEWLAELSLKAIMPEEKTHLIKISKPKLNINWALLWAAVGAIGTLLAGIGIPNLVDKLAEKSPPAKSVPSTDK
ncbi:MAG: serine/threonine-protein kinase [Spirulinaceae cyanobacterium]